MNELTHPQVQQLLARQAEVLSETEKAQVNAHLETCAACRGEVHALHELETRLRGGLHRRWDFVRTPNLHTAPALETYSKRKLMQKQTFRFVRFAFLTALLVLVLVGSLDWFLSTPTNKPDVTTSVQTPALDQVTTPVNEMLAVPDGWLVYSSNREGKMEIYLTDASGREEINLSNSSDDTYQPIWSPDGQQIAFMSNRNGDFQIFVMKANGTEITQLTNRTQLSEISFCSNKVPIRNVQFDKGGYFGLSWSPNGETLVATLPMSIDGNMFEPLFLIRTDGSGITQLTQGNDILSHWSPDGEQILFYRLADCDGEGHDLFSIYPDGTGLTNLTRDSALTYTDFVWSPDSLKIAYLVTNIDQNGEKYSELRVMDRSGANPIPLYREPVPQKITYSGSVAWSPDGKTLAFVMPGDNDTLMHLINPDGTNLRPLTTAADHYFDLDWSPDGNWIAFMAGIDTPMLYVLDVRNAPSLPDEWIRLTPPNTQNFGVSWRPTPVDLNEVTHAEPSIPPQITTIQMFDEQNGWGMATNFTSGLLLHTQDGGQTWQSVTPEGASYINHYFMLDAQTAWVYLAAHDNLVPEDQLLRTQDGGQSWQRFEVPFVHSIELQFQDAEQGWVLDNRQCDYGEGNCESNFGLYQAYQTSDGGETWNLMKMNAPNDPIVSLSFIPSKQLWFRDTTMAWVGGKTITSDLAIPLFVTHDNGQTWQEKQVPIIRHQTSVAFTDGITYSFPIILSDELIYQVATYRASEDGVSSFPVPAFLVTRDGGESWALNPMPDSWNGEIDFVSPLEAFAICGNALCVSHDGAQTWETLTSTLDFTETDSHHIKMDFVSPTTGWAVEYKPDTQMRWILYQTTDGGQTWTEISPVILP
ncbi:MAG: PD40 domain-containing protein [Anaerolineales bacterium]|nr:PD40 domain-containing protein [Anaerolineales bacterium]